MDNNCPLYEKGELLSLSERTLSCPENKSTCLILVREMTNILFEVLDAQQDQDSGIEEKVYSCSGCTGLIKFSRIADEQAQQEVFAAPAVSSLDEDAQQLFRRVRDFPFIQAIPESERLNVLGHFQKEQFRPNVTFITKGTSSSHLYLILSGDIVVTNNSYTIAHLGPGDICGEMSYLGNELAGMDVTTLSKVEILSVTGAVFSSILDGILELQLFMAKILVKRLTASNDRNSNTVDACMSGWIREMPPVELFQVFHMHQKTGVLELDLLQGKAKVAFREGCIINAQYGDKKSQAAIFAMLEEKEGQYRFTTGLSPEEMKAAEIGDFMMLLMEGVKRVDETDEGLVLK